MFYGVVVTKDVLREILGDDDNFISFDCLPDEEFPFDYHQLPHDINEEAVVVGVWVATIYDHNKPTFINTDLNYKIINAIELYRGLLPRAPHNIEALMRADPKLYSVADECQQCCS
ncbi:Hypothetical protein HVR_LOCUS908 [uncultured virus]|nr:Hypothetical protein HVR_LOCUS908 [uncultured virus]